MARTNARKFVDQQSQNTSDSECFDATNQQIWVHLWGPCVMGVYYIMIIFKIFRKRILINRIFDNRRYQNIVWWQLKEPLCRAWFGCSPSGYTPSDDYMEFPRSIQMTSRAALKGLSQAAVLWKPARQHTKQERQGASKWSSPERQSICTSGEIRVCQCH